jgi:hypothetical protein
MMKKIMIALVLILFVLAGVFLLFNFRLMKSTTVSNSYTAASNAGSDIKDWTFRPENTGLYVQADPRFVQSLQAEITRLLQSQVNVGSISAINQPVDRADIPQLYVEVKQQKKIWTPFYATSAYEVIVSYATNGDLSFRNTEPVTFINTSEQPAIRFQASYAIADRSVGLISLPGYDSYLADLFANAVQKSIQEQLKTK